MVFRISELFYDIAMCHSSCTGRAAIPQMERPMNRVRCLLFAVRRIVMLNLRLCEFCICRQSKDGRLFQPVPLGLAIPREPS